MGRELALEAEQWAPLIRGHRAGKVLSAMALRAFDVSYPGRAERIYDQGHGELAYAVGLVDRRSFGRGPNRSHLNEIGVDVAHLIELGAVTRVRSASPGKHAVYRVNPRPIDTG